LTRMAKSSSSGGIIVACRKRSAPVCQWLGLLRSGNSERESVTA
jgi:hypothetical protein